MSLLKSTGGFLSIAMFLHLLLILDLEHPALRFALSHLASNGRSTGDHDLTASPSNPMEPPPKKRIHVELQECQQATHINFSPGKMTYDHIWDAFVGLISNSQDSCPFTWNIQTSVEFLASSWLIHGPMVAPIRRYTWKKNYPLAASLTLHLARGTFYIFCNKNKHCGMIRHPSLGDTTRFHPTVPANASDMICTRTRRLGNSSCKIKRFGSSKPKAPCEWM